ncbi:50S ribosomal protein L19e [Candidatus Pacearchaeota archaeon CG06_land_8_20_14_3_00_35_12]|nr:MAG: 50S ribosomal protein L19e [Candidatus Pacearchaeota archaeon CG06_land_8_20_14_3_00_35_12]
MRLETQKRISADILGIGKKRIWFDPLRISDIQEAITRQDLKDLIKEGAIKKMPVQGVKRRSGKTREGRYAKGRRRGMGKIRKRIQVRKKEYVWKIRKMRKYLKMLRREGKINKTEHTKMRRLAKSGIYSNIHKIKEVMKAK